MPPSPYARSTSMNFSPKLKPASGAQGTLAHAIKRASEVGNVPFGQTKRVKADDAHNRNDTLTKTAFSWKTPSVML